MFSGQNKDLKNNWSKAINRHDSNQATKVKRFDGTDVRPAFMTPGGVQPAKPGEFLVPFKNNKKSMFDSPPPSQNVKAGFFGAGENKSAGDRNSGFGMSGNTKSNEDHLKQTPKFYGGQSVNSNNGFFDSGKENCHNRTIEGGGLFEIPSQPNLKRTQNTFNSGPENNTLQGQSTTFSNNRSSEVQSKHFQVPQLNPHSNSMPLMPHPQIPSLSIPASQSLNYRPQESAERLQTTESNLRYAFSDIIRIESQYLLYPSFDNIESLLRQLRDDTSVIMLMDAYYNELRSTFADTIPSGILHQICLLISQNHRGQALEIYVKYASYRVAVKIDMLTK